MVKKSKSTVKSVKKLEESTHIEQDNQLLQEIHALGGDAQDLELIAGVDESDQDENSDDDNAMTFTHPEPQDDDADLKSFMSRVGLNPDSSMASEFFAGENDDSEDDSADKSSDEKSNEVPTLVNAASSGPTLTPDEEKLRMQLQPSSNWYNLQLPELPALKKVVVNKKVPEQLSVQDQIACTAKLQDYAKELLRRESLAFVAYKKKSSASDYEWLHTVLKSGTLTDRVSALSLAVQESPIHAWNYLDSLMNMARKKSRREALLGVDAVKDLMLGNGENSGVLPSDRKLLFFREQQHLAAVLEDFTARSVVSKIIGLKNILDVAGFISVPLQSHLMMWQFEDMVKGRYYELIVLMDNFSRDPVQHIKSKMISHAWALLVSKKEQERTLLTFLVNKFGDLEKKVASKVVYLLQQVLVRHPAMKLVVAREVEVFLFRKGVSDRAKYYATVFLNQIVLTKSFVDVLTGRALINIYFSIFESLACLEPPSDDRKKQTLETLEAAATAGIEAKTMSALLTGINRAFPYASTKLAEDSQDQKTIRDSSVAKLVGLGVMEEVYDKHVNTLFRITHIPEVSFSTSVQAMHLVFQLIYRPSISHSKENKVDENAVAVFQPKLSARYFRALYALLLDSRLQTSMKPFALLLNLIFKSLKQCTCINTLVACIRRLLQNSVIGFAAVTPGAGCAFECASLIVVSEVLKQKKTDAEFQRVFDRMIKEGVEAWRLKFGVNENDEEKFVDAAGDESNAENGQAELPVKTSDANPVDNTYQPFNRSPEFSKPAESSLWELASLTKHYHPTVRLFANSLLYRKDGVTNLKSSNDINYPSDPLEDFTLIHFLDRFVYKNPKVLEQGKKTSKGVKGHQGESAMQPKPFHSTLLRRSVPLDRSQDVVITSNKWRESSGVEKGKEQMAIPADEKFYYQFFRNKFLQNGAKSKKLRKRKDDDSSDQDIEDDGAEVDAEFDSMDEGDIHNAIMSTVPDGDAAIESDGAEGSEMDEEFERMMKEGAAHSDAESAEPDVGDEDELLRVEGNDDEPDFEGDELDDESLDDVEFSENDSDDDDISDGEEFNDLGSDVTDMSDEDETEKKPVKKGVKSHKLDAIVKSAALRSTAVFASAEDYSHLLAEPGFHSTNWTEEEEGDSEEEEPRKKFNHKRKGPQRKSFANKRSRK